MRPPAALRAAQRSARERMQGPGRPAVLMFPVGPANARPHLASIRACAPAARVTGTAGRLASIGRPQVPFPIGAGERQTIADDEEGR